MTDTDGDTDSDTTTLAWETLDSRTAYECPGFLVKNESVRLPDGTETEFDYVSEPAAVVVLPFTTEGEDEEEEVVVIEEWRQAIKRVNRGLPAGSVESEDENLEATAHRELREETGYEAGRMDYLCSVEPTNGVADWVHHYFVAHDCEPTNEQNLDFNESIQVDTTTITELRDAIHTGDIRDGRTVLGVLYHHTFGSSERNV